MAEIAKRKFFNPCGESDQLVVHLYSLKMAVRIDAKNAKRSFATKIKIRDILTRSFASHFKLRFAQPFLANISGQLIGHFPRKG